MAVLVESVSVEPMRVPDLEAVQAVDRRCFPMPWQAVAYVTELSNRAAAYFVARKGGNIVGYGGVWVVGEEAHITTLAVDALYRRRRIGERLVLALMEEAVIKGANHCTLEVREGNRSALALYRKFGFRDAALRKSYYTDNGENAIVMWADAINTLPYQRRLRAVRQSLYHLNHSL